jgi:uncharacterized protein
MYEVADRRWHDHFREEASKVVEYYLPKDYTPQRFGDKKVIRDAVWDFNTFFQHEISLIDTPLVQRLRGIHQTALAYYTYPSATHNRFQHSLGATALAEKVLGSLDDKLSRRNEKPIPLSQRYEVRLAALLHDISHGPFSHGTEEYFRRHPGFQGLKDEDPKLFGTTQPGEMLAYFMVTSKPFATFWEKIKSLYPDERDLGVIDLERVARLILGNPSNPRDLYLAQIINGPFDVDKLDYLPRDGYNTGLHLDIDVDRLFLALDLENDAKTKSTVLTIDLSGVAALEQLLFGKMLIFTSVYHHHKVRASLWSLFQLLDCLLETPEFKGSSLADPELKDGRGRPYPNPFAFLLLEDGDILQAHDILRPSSSEIVKRVGQLVSDLKQRKLLKRALVLSLGTIEEDGSASEFARLCDPENRRKLADEICDEIVKRSNLRAGDVVIDIPKPPRFESMSREARIRLSRERVADLEDVFPTRGWVTGYAEYKNRIYIFAPEEHRAIVGRRSVEVLKSRGMSTKAEALELAKQDHDFVISMFPIPG